MPFDPAAVPRKLIEAAQQRNLVPLIGAGFSKQAGDMFPTWRQLLVHMKERALSDGLISPEEGKEIDTMLDRGLFLMAAEALRSTFHPDDYAHILEEQFNPFGPRPAEVHRALFRVRPPLILTTNYDRLIEDAYAAEHGRAATVLTYRDTTIAQRYLQSSRLPDRPVVYKLHGTIDEPETVVLTERDYRDLIYRQPGYRMFLSAIFLTHVVLMLGFSFSDREITMLLEIIRDALKHAGDPDYIFLPKGMAGPLEARRWKEDYGIQVIPYEATPGHPEVLEFVNFLASKVEEANPGAPAGAKQP